jgi:actin-related protein 10
MDLRKTLSSSIVVVGGSSMLPGFIPRLHAELLQAVIPISSPSRPQMRPGRPVPPPYDRYASLRPLVPHIAILNNPSPRAPIATTNAGKAPAFSPATIAWVGGSLAGYESRFFHPSNHLPTRVFHFYPHRALKTGGVEVSREKWDEACSREDPDDSMDDSAEGTVRSAASILPDWTKLPLPPALLPVVQLPRGSPQAQVGA